MTRSYKWIGGIGYILTFIPYANFVSSLITSIAWILMGKETREKIFTATGVLMIITFALTIGIVALILTALPSLTLLIPSQLTGPPLQLFQRIGHILTPILIIGLILAGVAIVAAVLEIVSHFKAGKIFNNTWFRLGGWFRIGLIIAVVISIPLIVMSATNILALGAVSPGAAVLGTIFSILWPLIIVVIVGLLSIIFSIVAFFTIPETEEFQGESSSNP